MALTPIPEYEGRYAISDDGRVWSYPKATNYKSGRWMKTSVNARGYCNIVLRKDGKKKTYLVHRLIAELFCNKPEGCNEVNHIDGDKTNNHPDNLEWVTSSENSAHSWSNGLQEVTEGQRLAGKISGKKTRRMSFDDAEKIRELYKTGDYTQRHLGQMYNVSRDAVGLIIRNQTYLER